MASDSSATPSDETSGEPSATKTDATSPVDDAQMESPAATPAAATPPPAEPTAPEVIPTDAASQAEPAPASKPAPDNTASPGSPASGEPKRKIQVGSRRQPGADQRPNSTRPATPAALELPQELVDAVKPDASESIPYDSAPIPMPNKEPVPVPSIREPLSAEMQSEIDAAMGDVKLDDLVAVPKETGTVEEVEEDQRRQATVIRVEGENVFFDLGDRVEGLVPIRQFKEPPAVGDAMEVVVRSLNGEDGFYELSVPGQSISVADWSDLVEGAVVDARITGANTGGLECMVGNIRGFIPASQVAMFRVEDFAEYIGQSLPCVCTEVNERKKNLVVSHRAVLEREREEARKKLLEDLKPGQVREGVVRSLRDFGAFVDLGGIDGMVHISQLSWERVKHPSDVLTEGQKIKVKVEKVNLETGKIGLSFRDLSEHPWNDIETKCVVGSTVRGNVTRTAKFGAFVRLFPGVEGLIHISELSHQHVRNVDSVLQEGQEIEVKVMSVDRESQRIGLSLKATLPEPVTETAEAEAEPEQPARPKRTKPLKGGIGRGSGGESVGLNW